MIIEVDVTADDIEQGVAKSAGYCPIARAARRAFHQPISVYDNYMSTRNVHMEMPREAKDFVRTFDLGWRTVCQPFKFVIDTDQVEM